MARSACATVFLPFHSLGRRARRAVHRGVSSLAAALDPFDRAAAGHRARTGFSRKTLSMSIDLAQRRKNAWRILRRTTQQRTRDKDVAISSGGNRAA